MKDLLGRNPSDYLHKALFQSNQLAPSSEKHTAWQKQASIHKELFSLDQINSAKYSLQGKNMFFASMYLHDFPHFF